MTVVVAAVALTVLPSAPADAAGSVAYCAHVWTDTATPGIGMTPSHSQISSNGERWPLMCQGVVRGQQVTGPGTFGEEAVVDGTCSSGSGRANFSFTIPTTAGPQKFRMSFPFSYGPGGGASQTADFPGAFVFFPTAGDCLNEPVTEFMVVRNAVLIT